MASDVESAVASSGAGGFERRKNVLRNDDAGNFIVEAKCLFVTIERPDADEYGDRWLAAEFFHERVPMLGIEDGLSHREVRPGFDFGVEALDFIVEIVGDRVDGHADGKVGCAPERFPGPVRALIEAAEHFNEADGIDFVDAAGFRIIADGWRVAGDSEHVANAADGPCSRANTACKPMMLEGPSAW